MELHSRRIGVLVLLGFLLGPLTAQAAPGWYLGVNAGSSQFSSPEDLYPVHGGTGAVSASGNASGWLALAGYQYTPHFALEFGYSELGSASATATEETGAIDPITLTPVVVTNSEKIKLTALSADAVFQTSDTGFCLFGRLGLTDTHLDESFSLGGGNSVSKLTYGYGAGVGYRTNTPWSWRLGWSEFVSVGGQHSSDVSFLNLGLSYSL